MEGNLPKLTPLENVVNTKPEIEVEKPLRRINLSINRRGSGGTNSLRYSGMDFYGTCPHGHGIQTECAQCVLDTVAASDMDVLSLDVGGANTPSPVSKDLICVYSKRTGGGGHQIYEYIRKDRMSVKEFCKYLNAHKQNNISVAEYDEEKRKVTVWSNSLGLWIGTKGRWQKAYGELGFDVDFKELETLEVSEYASLPEELQDLADAEKKVVENDHQSGGEANNFKWGIPKDSIFWKKYKNRPDVPVVEIKKAKEEKSKKEFERRTEELGEFFEYCKILAEEYSKRGLDIEISRDTLFSYNEVVAGDRRRPLYEEIHFDIKDAGPVNYYNPQKINLILYKDYEQDIRLGGVHRFTVIMPEKAKDLTEESLERLLQNKLTFKSIKLEYDSAYEKLENAKKKYEAYLDDFERDNPDTLLYSASVNDDSAELFVECKGKKYPCDIEGMSLFDHDIEEFVKILAEYSEKKIAERKRTIEPPKPLAEVEPVVNSVEKSSLEIEFEREITGKGALYSRIISIQDGKIIGIRNIGGDIVVSNTVDFSTGSRSAHVNTKPLSISVFSSSGNKMSQYQLPENGSVLLGRNGDHSYIVETNPILKVVSSIANSPSDDLPGPSSATHNPFDVLKNWK
jgi:hypothetical protein